MTALDPNRPEELAASEGRYWAALEITLTRVFDVKSGVGEHYRRDLMEAPPLQRAMALHDHPLDVAATLTGQSLTADRVALYDDVISSLATTASSVRDIRARRAQAGAILSSAPIDESAPMVTVVPLNKFMRELGYHRLTVRRGVAYYLLERTAWKRPLPREISMQALPGLNADREEVYGLDQILTMLNGMQEFARRQRPASSIITRIEKMKKRLLMQSNARGP
jgi:hypothetical protein